MPRKQNWVKNNQTERRPSITSYYKRKTADTSFEEDPFAKSKKIERSPIKKKEENCNDEMDELKEMMKEQMKEIKEMRKDYETIRTELADVKERLINKEKYFDQKVESLNKKINTLEKKLEYKEKQDKRNNIIIKGLKLEENKGREATERLFTECLEVNIKPREIRTLGREKNIIKVILNSWDEKYCIMRKKRELKRNKETEKVFIEDDLTEQEMKIRKIINETAKEHREEGRATKTGYKKLQVDGKWWIWDEERGKLVEAKN